MGICTRWKRDIEKIVERHVYIRKEKLEKFEWGLLKEDCTESHGLIKRLYNNLGINLKNETKI